MMPRKMQLIISLEKDEQKCPLASKVYKLDITSSLVRINDVQME